MTLAWRIVGFLCETTLNDQDQRVSLIGIMPGRLVAPGFPFALSLGAFIRINPLPSEGTPFKVSIHLGEQVVASIEGVSVPLPSDANNEFGLDSLLVNIGRIGMLLTEPGLIKMWVSVGGSEPELVSVLRVSQAEAPEPPV
jgi:hypothetical protein